MEINITRFFNDACPRDYAASVAEIGADAGPATWRAACDDANDYGPLLDTPEKLDAMRDHVRGFGAWSDNEIAAWSDTELNALFLQFVSGDIRETPEMEPETWDWDKYQAMSEAGTVCGRMFRAENGEIFYYLGE